MSGSILPFRRGPRPGARSGAADPSLAARNPPQGGTVGTATPPGPFEASRFRDLIAPHIDAAYSLARYLARDPTAAEDIAQEALLRAFRAVGSLRGEAKPWLLAIVRNAYFDSRRQNRGWTVTGPEADAAMEQTPDPAQESAETALVRQGDVAQLRDAIAKLPEPFREALVLRDLEELSYREVAAVTGVPMGTVMSRLARARRMLGERLGLMEAAP
jgi:RNA polymerase sigma-70 factor (ECF subfamily)